MLRTLDLSTTGGDRQAWSQHAVGSRYRLEAIATMGGQARCWRAADLKLGHYANFRRWHKANYRGKAGLRLTR